MEETTPARCGQDGGAAPGGGALHCPAAWDTVLCWPATAAGSLARLPCFEEFQGVKYDPSQNATRLCRDNGTWDSYSDYSACLGAELSPAGLDSGVEVSSTLYLVGYCVSLAALCVAIGIFLYCKDLRCLRNTIHTNLMATYVLADLLWILNLSLQTSMNSNTTSCVVLTILLHYFLLTTYFWMFVEGLYLYLLVVETFSGDHLKLRVYILIGWGVPLVIVILWSLAKSLARSHLATRFVQTPETHEHSRSHELGASCCLDSIAHCRISAAALQAEHLQPCLSSPWMTPHNYDWIFKAPIIAVLAVNSVFLVTIMWVLITKLRSANTAETQQYRKASKALLVLIPLLGVAYVLTMLGPSEGLGGHIFIYLRVALLSTQGFTVALFYCFLNTEVQNALRHRAAQWRAERSLRGRRCNYSSPRSRTESIRGLFQQQGRGYRQRESTVSQTTTTSVVGGPGNGACLSARTLLAAEKVA